MASFEKNLVVNSEPPANAFPHEPPTDHPQKIRLTPEEIKVLRECNRESFYFRCVPFSTVAMTGVHFLVKAGYLRPNPHWGSTLKVLTAGFLGYIIGKFSYQQKCVEKIMQLPNSNLGEALRKKQSRGISDKLEFDLDSLRNQQNVIPEESKYNYDSTRDRIGVDVDKNIVYEGLDDAFRPSVDNENTVKDEIPSPIPSKHITYEELRDKNRADHENKIRNNFLKRSPTLPSSLPKPSPPSIPTPTIDSEPAPVTTRQKKGKYGDVWDD